ncbi:MFS transporter [Allofournierella sp.]|uniref:MFS transporter n=1 Tax=Allofournierella sp. TaxID=1940256 RepID=UPI003AB54D37
MKSSSHGPGAGTKAQGRFLAQAAFGTAFGYLTSGVCLTGLAIWMGAGDVLVSYLSVALNLCGVLTLAFAAFLERFSSKKRLALGLTVLSRLATVVIAAIPAVLPQRLWLAAFVPAVLVAFTLQAQTTVVLNQWMLAFVEEKNSGRYISLRQTFTLVVTVALSVAGGYWLDRMEGQYWGFALLFAAAGALGAAEVAVLARTPDSGRQAQPAQRCRLRQLVGLPVRNRRFLGFVAYILAFYLLLNVSDSFTMGYMIKYLELPYQTVTALYMLISLPQVVWLGIWGRISDRWGHRRALAASLWLFAGETLFMAFAGPGSWQVFIPAAFLVSSVANAGFAVAVFNRRYELMPRENRIVYDNFYTAAIGLGVMLGPMAGGAVKSAAQASQWIAGAAPFAEIRLLYLLSTAGILLLQLLAVSAGRRGRAACRKACAKPAACCTAGVEN